MPNDLRQQAILWFINRYIHISRGKKFLRTLHGIDPMPTGGNELWNFRFRRQHQNADMDIDFIPNARDPQIIQVEPFTAQAVWATGIIFLDGSNFVYQSRPQHDLFEQLDKPIQPPDDTYKPPESSMWKR